MQALRAVSLDDKYSVEDGRIYVTGVQALVRLPMVQRQRDAAAGLNTAGFISGYRGSPLGGYDTALWSARKFLERDRIVFRPGINEDLAATAVWGTQQVNLFDGAETDGVFGIWYGKGPGVDRSMDVLKHGNLAGTSAHGGVLVLTGDDHGAWSSSTAHQSEQVLQAAMIPVLNPAEIAEYLAFGLFGFALSRFSGCWVGFKALTETVDTSSSIPFGEFPAFRTPDDFQPPVDGLNIRLGDTALAQERRLHGPKMAAVRAFARANGIDRMVSHAGPARLGIAATGKAYLDLRQALDLLQIGERERAQLGIRLYKIGLSWPLEPAGLEEFARGLEEILVVEEKRGVVEDQVARLLFNSPATLRPRLVGKLDVDGTPLLPSHGELSPILIARALVRRIAAIDPQQHDLARRLDAVEARAAKAPVVPITTRTAFFCSGCPHNTSTRVPEGSRAAGGIGCHYMAAFMPARRTSLPTQMGGEGVNWIGQAPFTCETHLFQNIGDGTYFHSGLMAIRAAAAAGVNITYKILYNDAVAMTGGQMIDGQLSVAEITRQVAAEGARKIVVVSDDINKYGARPGFAPGVELHHRDDLDRVQRALRDVPGLTILVYDQTCAAEKRRRRKRGTMADPDRRVVINDRVCENCGDCSEQSSCVSVKPIETAFGRKRTIDQSACNKDYSCVKGFCPSFVTVRGGRLRKSAGADLSDRIRELPPVPISTLDRPFSLIAAGIGGSGIVTIGAVLGMAAHLEGKACTVLDLTGMAQKNGAVTSHIRIAASDAALRSVRIVPGMADVLLGCDMVVAASAAAITACDRDRTHAVINDNVQPTIDFILDRDADVHRDALARSLSDATRNTEFVPATDLAVALSGDAIGANLLLLGFVFQRGLLPLSLDAIEAALTLNGVAVDAGKRVFGLGRLAAHDPQAMHALLAATEPPGRRMPETLDELIDHRADFLAAYQNRRYARAYRDFVSNVRTTESRHMPASQALTEAVARNLAKLMAYKDEYEVARLFTDGVFRTQLKREFQGDVKLEFNLAPPLSARRDAASGRPRKFRVGAWMLPVFRGLAAMRRLRGTPFDPFGRTAERRAERALIRTYQADIKALLPDLSPVNHAKAVALAALPDSVRGYGPVKAASIADYGVRRAALLAEPGARQDRLAAD